MPPLPNVPGVIRVHWKHTDAADIDVVFRAYFAYTGTPPTNAQAVTMSTTLATNWGTHVKALAATNVTLTEVGVTDLTSNTAATGVFAASVAGTRAGSGNPIAVCAAINFHVARRYRGGKPKIFTPYGTSSDTGSSETWAPAFVTAMNTGWTNTVSDVVAAVWAGGTITGQVNVSYYSGFTVFNPGGGRRAKNIPTLRVNPLVDPITSIATQAIYGSQRRRNRS